MVVTAVLAGGCSLGAQVEEPTLKVEAPVKAPPAPQGTTLRLIATDVDACDGADSEVVDVIVSETQTEVVIEAGLRTEERFQLHCEIRTTYDHFVVELDRPLGDRRVIDDSRGERSVIWSPRKRKDVLARRAVTVPEAERFLSARFPGGQAVDCARRRPGSFFCTLRAPSRRKPVEFYVMVGRDAKLKALAATHAAFSAKEELKRPRN